jgi:hypothetical protein
MKKILSLDEFLKDGQVKPANPVMGFNETPDMTSEDEEGGDDQVEVTNVELVEEPESEEVEIEETPVETEETGEEEEGSEEDEDEDDEDEDEDDEEEKESTEQTEEMPKAGGEMAVSQLEKCIDFSTGLRKRIKEGDWIEPWVSVKLTLAMDYLQSVANYYDGKDGEIEGEEMEEGEE